MKRQIARQTLRLSRRDVIWTILGLALWGFGATYARAWLIKPHCATNPASCTAENVPLIDRYSLGLENMSADNDSHLLQTAAAVLGVVIPATWNLLPGGAAWSAVGTDFVIVLQTAAWNGVGVEASHLLAQRTRPFVYKDPVGLGRDPAHYTSFYSGHASFVTAVLTAALLILFARGARARTLVPLVALSQVMMIATAYCRVVAGRHFLTDTLVASAAGILVAYGIVRAHLKRL